MEELLGRGGHGSIYSVGKALVRKESCNILDCISNKREYILQGSAYDIVKDLTYSGIKIPRPTDWEDQYRVNERGDICCSYEMDRIYPPDDGSHIWQAYIYAYDANMDKISEVGGFVRGRYVGANKISELLQLEDKSIEDITYKAGILLGALQYGSRQTAIDTELILGRDSNGDLFLYLIDFDRSSFWEDGNLETGLPYTGNKLDYFLTKPMEDEEFYPGSDDPELYEKFKEGYFEIAEKFGYLELAQSVISLRDSMF